jgi:hypothetical protein
MRDAETPAARQAEQSPAQDANGEVLLCDRGVAALPALSERAQVTPTRSTSAGV